MSTRTESTFYHIWCRVKHSLSVFWFYPRQNPLPVTPQELCRAGFPCAGTAGVRGRLCPGKSSPFYSEKCSCLNDALHGPLQTIPKCYLPYSIHTFSPPFPPIQLFPAPSSFWNFSVLYSLPFRAAGFSKQNGHYEVHSTHVKTEAGRERLNSGSIERRSP